MVITLQCIQLLTYNTTSETYIIILKIYKLNSWTYNKAQFLIIIISKTLKVLWLNNLLRNIYTFCFHRDKICFIAISMHTSLCFISYRNEIVFFFFFFFFLVTVYFNKFYFCEAIKLIGNYNCKVTFIPRATKSYWKCVLQIITANILQFLNWSIISIDFRNQFRILLLIH